MIPYGKQEIIQEDIDTVVEVLKSDFLTQGPQVPLFEKAIADYVSAEHAIAVNSATSALHIACLVLGLGKGDWLWTSPITFVASANCGFYCGARVDFVDIDLESYNLCPMALEQKLAVAEREGRLPKILVAVHMAGQACDMQSIHRLSQRYGFSIIEDASHAIGGRYLNQSIGSCRYSDITVFSFHPVKIVTTAEGGVATTNNAGLAKKMCLYRSHGVTRDAEDMTEVPHGAWYYQQVALGFNYRMTDIQAALGVSQLKRINDFVKKRHMVASKYDQQLRSLPVVVPRRSSASYSAFHLYIIRLKLAEISLSHREVFEQLRQNNIGVNLHYIPLYKQPYYRAEGCSEDFPNAEKYYSEAISLPMFHHISDEQINTVVEALRKILL